MDYLHTLSKYKDQLISFKLQREQTMLQGRLMKYDTFGITVQLYRLRGDQPEKFYPWTNISEIGECPWQEPETGVN